MTNDNHIILKAKKLGMFGEGDVITLVSKILHDAHQFNPNYFELNLREKAEFEWKWVEENIINRKNK